MKAIYHISRVLIILLLSLGGLSGCITLLPATTAIKKDIGRYTRVYIPATQTVHSPVSAASNDLVSYSQSVNPRDVIAGLLAKRGYIILDQLDERFRKETIIVNYGESGKRVMLLGSTIEVTLQFVSAETGELLCTTTAEGCGSTEAEDIKEAVTRALEALFK